jgi:hypothetical protein
MSVNTRIITNKTFKYSHLIRDMRFIIRAQIPTEAGNKMVKDPNFIKNVEDYMKKSKAETAYFFEAHGNRTIVFIVDDQIPALAEPLFQEWGANVEFHPVMTLEDLKKGVPG